MRDFTVRKNDGPMASDLRLMVGFKNTGKLAAYFYILGRVTRELLHLQHSRLIFSSLTAMEHNFEPLKNDLLLRAAWGGFLPFIYPLR